MSDLDTTTPVTGGSRTDARAKAADLLSKYTKGQKIAGVVVVVAVVLGLLFVTRLAGAAKFAPLFTDLAASDAAAITEQLDTEGIPYELADGGSTIMVPSEQVYSARLKVAAEGIPGDSEVGYGVLDDQGLTTSEFGQRVGFQRAMEGELSKTIEALDVVETATVHLALPDENAFALADQTASASVLVRTSPGETMSDEQVQSVVNLVASSIKNLSPKDVTVADSDGTVLAAPGQTPTGSGSGGGGRQKQTAQFEESVAGSIEEMLTKAVGPGAASATVSAQLDFDETNVSRETFEAPEPGADGEGLRMQDSTKNETYTGEGSAVSGVLGPDSPANTAGGGGTDYELEEADVQYALNRVVESTNTAPGAIEKLSVAVMVDESKVPADLVDSLEGLVAAAAGVDPERGDVLAISRVPFDDTQAEAAEEELKKAEEAEAAEASAARMQTIALGVLLFVMLLVAFFLYRRSAKQRRKRAQLLAELQMASLPAALPGASASYPAAGIAAGIQDYGPNGPIALGGEPAGLSAGAGGVLAPPRPVLAATATDSSDQQRVVRQAQLAEMVDQQPDEVAQLMRGWLDDGRGGRS